MKIKWNLGSDLIARCKDNELSVSHLAINKMRSQGLNFEVYVSILSTVLERQKWRGVELFDRKKGALSNKAGARLARLWLF